MIFTLSKRQLSTLATKVRMVTKASFKISKYIIYILPESLSEVWHKIMMVLDQQSATPRI